MKHLFLGGSLLCLLTLSGCANLDSIYRPINTSDGTGALIDIKQRAILATQQRIIRQTEVTDPKTKEVKRDYSNDVRTRVCAEPSPDALSAYAIELAAKGKHPQNISGELALSSQEAASFVGLRTQSIQVLRDSMYRICEAYMSGGIDETEFDIMLRRSQKYMVALLGIEQLTGVVKVPPVTINTSGSALVSRPVTELRQEAKAIEKEISEIKAKKNEEVAKFDVEINALNEKKKKLTDDKKPQADIDVVANQIASKVNDKQMVIDSAEADISARNGDKKLLDNAIANPTGLSTSGQASATVVVNAINSQRTDNHIQAIAKDVKEIVLNVINTDDTGALCFGLLSKNDKAVKNGKEAELGFDPNKISGIKQNCEDYYFETVNALRITNTTRTAYIDTLKEVIFNSDSSMELKKYALESLRDLALGIDPSPEQSQNAGKKPDSSIAEGSGEESGKTSDAQSKPSIETTRRIEIPKPPRLGGTFSYSPNQKLMIKPNKE